MMQLESWIFLGILCAGIAAVLCFRCFGVITTDKAVVWIGGVAALVRKAEEIWKGERGAGEEKKEWVQAQLKMRKGMCSPELVSSVIDALVQWLNEEGWN